MIYIKDNTTNTVHKYGTSQHDSLMLSEDGSLEYYNLQNGVGTKYPEEGYSFCYKNGEVPDSDASPDERIMNIGGDNDKWYCTLTSFPKDAETQDYIAITGSGDTVIGFLIKEDDGTVSVSNLDSYHCNVEWYHKIPDTSGKSHKEFMEIKNFLKKVSK